MGITLLASATLNETLEQVVALVFEAVPADRCMIMMRDKDDAELQVAVARLRDRAGEVGEIRVSRSVIEEVVVRGKSVLTSDAQADPRFMSGTVMLQGVRSVLAVPLGVSEKILASSCDSPRLRPLTEIIEMLTTSRPWRYCVANTRAGPTTATRAMEPEFRSTARFSNVSNNRSAACQRVEIQGIISPARNWRDYTSLQRETALMCLGDVGKGAHGP